MTRNKEDMQTHIAHRVIKNTGFLYAKMGITAFISLYTTRLILNALGESDFGIFTIIGGAIAMLGFLNAAMTGATQRFMSYAEGEGDKEKQKTIFNVSVVLHFLIALLMGVVLLVAGYFFFNGILNIPPDRIFAARIVYYFMVASTMITIMTVPYDAAVNAHEDMLYFAIVGIIESVLKLAAAIVVVYTLTDKLIIYGALMAGISFSVMVVMRVYCHRKYQECVFKPRLYFNKGLMKEMTGFSGWNLLGTSSTMIAFFGQGIVLNIFFGTIINAAQGIAVQVCGQLGSFAWNLLKALNPVIAKNEGKGDRTMMLKATMTGTKVAFFLLMFFFVPVLVEMRFIFKIWLKNIPDYTIIFCQLVFARFLVDYLYSTLVSSIVAVGKIRNYFICISVLTLLILPAGYLFFSLGFPPYSLHITYLVVTCLSLAITVFFASRVCGLPASVYITQVIFRCLIPFAITLALSSIPVLFMESGFGRFFLVLVINGIAYAGTIWFYGFTNSERAHVTQIASAVVKKIRTIKT